MSENSIEFTQVHHVGVPVWDADSASDFYERAGVPVIYDEVLEEYNIRAVFLDFDGVYLELLEPTGPGNVKTFLQRRGPGYQHLAYQVPDLTATVDELRERGVTFQSDEPLSGAKGTSIIFVEEQNTGGLQTELVEDRSG